ncbi:MAG: PAQR family membrane homeostasis protein TrhA [Butyricicoccus sp.]|nr:hemolysin III family protein [Butyricicoccus pullicaecorum]
MPRIFQKARDPFSCYSHFLGAVGSVIGLFLMLSHAVRQHAGAMTMVSVSLFCLSLTALYTASAVYHYALAGEQTLRLLKKLDHSMIYILIAGSYTPIVLRYLKAPDSYLFLAVIWGIALFGIAVKLLWIDAPRLLGTILYLLMGWAVLFRLDVVLSMATPAIVLLALGGLSYTIGGVIYILKKPNCSPLIGFHELFHLFVLAGSLAHYLVVYWFVL